MQCDIQAREARDSLAAALDPMASEIALASAGLPPDGHYRRVTVGPTYVRELVTPFTAHEPPIHVASSATWQKLAEDYAAIAFTPIDVHWINLNASVRFRISDDWRRLIDHNLAGSSVGPQKSPASNFVSNNGVSFRDGAFHVLLDPGPFASVESAIAAYIEDVWKNDSHTLRVDWTDAAHEPNAYRISLESAPGGRSYVNRTERVVHLFPDVRAKSIAHEIGHVLGFADRYYTSWNDSTCTYDTLEDDVDVMSVVETGAPTDAEWAVLDQVYR